jgi:hypothetical protein
MNKKKQQKKITKQASPESDYHNIAKKEIHTYCFCTVVVVIVEMFCCTARLR